jgi:hypothetical protein
MLVETPQRFVDDSPGGEAPIRGYLHRAGPGETNFLVLTHGASGDCNAPLLVALANAFADAGLNVLRCDLPYRQRKPTGPPSRSDAERDQQGLLRAVLMMTEQFRGRAFLGGSSYGGRQASLLASVEPELVAGLLLLSYPLHPPGNPAQLRTAHFSRIHTPSLFVSGTHDSFGSIDELEHAIKLIPGRRNLVAVEGASHGLTDKRLAGTVPKLVLDAFRQFFH